MDFNVSVNAVLPFLTLLQGFLFGILFILRGRREERYSDFWLALLMFLLSVSVIPFMLGWLGVGILWEKFTFLPWDGFGWAAVPTTFLFLKSLTNDAWRFNWRRDGWHFLPYFFVFFYHLIIGGYGLFDRNFVLNWWHHSEVNLYIDKFLTVASYLQAIFYFYLSWKLYQEYRKWTETQFSDTEKVSYKWFRDFLIFNIIVTLAGILNQIYLSFVSFGYDRMWLSYTADAFLVYYVSIAGYAQARVRSVQFEGKKSLFEGQNQDFNSNLLENAVYTEGVSLDKNVQNELSTDELKPKSLTLSSEELANWKERILALMHKDKLYLQPDLTLSDLAATLKTNTSVLSLAINAGFEKNFNDFINEYRVEDFKAKMASKEFQHLTLLAVAFESGFNSKTTFNRAFKKFTNQNPSDFQK